MAASKKPRKPHRKCWNAGGVLLKSEPWKVRAVFGPLEAILDQLEQHGTVDIAGNGAPVSMEKISPEPAAMIQFQKRRHVFLSASDSPSTISNRAVRRTCLCSWESSASVIFASMMLDKDCL